MGGLILINPNEQKDGYKYLEVLSNIDALLSLDETIEKCSNLSIKVEDEEFNNWMLPSENELSLICDNLQYNKDEYWNSSDLDKNELISRYVGQTSNDIRPKVKLLMAR